MSNLTAAEIVKAARSEDKITGLEMIQAIFPDFFELHGDRVGHDDPAIVGGLATLNGQAVTVITTDRGESISERVAKHFGSPEPGGYRKALRLAENAAKFKRPVIMLVNTAGAFPGTSAEEGGQGQAIAENLLKLSQLPTPIITIIYGEGGSGGALALACGDQVWMLENSTYSVLSPEGFASILWKDSSRADEAAEVMKMTPQALLSQDVIEGIIPESSDHNVTIENVKTVLVRELANLQALDETTMLNQRQARYRKF